MPIFRQFSRTQRLLTILDRNHERIRSCFLGGCGLLVMLTACGGTPVLKLDSQGNAPTTTTAPIASHSTTTENPPDATPDRDRPSKVDPTQTSTRQTFDVPDVLRPAIETLRNQTQIPVLLPDRLPLPDDPIYTSTRADADRYTIDLGYVPDCRGNACMIGTIAARRGSGDYYERGEPFAQTIKLAAGTPAYFNPSVCGASCAPPVLEWEYGGARYRMELKGLSEAEALGVLSTLANSAIAAGDRLR